MPTEIVLKNNVNNVSRTAQNLIGSEIIKLAGEIKEKISNGEKIYNLTIGDFDSKIFPIPTEFREEIVNAYRNYETNYPDASGVKELRNSVSDFLKKFGKLNYNSDEILISGGARPLIFALYQTLLDKDDKVVFPVPSWNNNHYTYLSHANAKEVETLAENKFMPTANELKPHLKDATLLALCSPLNPTGTMFDKDELEEICELIIKENESRGEGQKPLYLMYDQIYWTLAFGEVEHVNPVTINPKMRNYTIFIDGMSKAFAATGVRVGWAMGPENIISKMKAILTHIGAWSPKPEQIAAAKYLANFNSVAEYINKMNERVKFRLMKFHNGIQQLKNEGFPVDSIAPEGAIYLTVKLQLKGFQTKEGKILQNSNDITQFLINEAKIALVPFSAFGAHNSEWFRLSVGTCPSQDIEPILSNLKNAIEALTF
ncbi:MAG: aminotransferase class I/II-fold pyridoxal phosphate-dependent enzyme [Bacteroidia bacterium]|nr:aminotransferase class I/II-fold pyridoxal phosphate-dependent enzyme [Bacteroidia bacterium]